MVIFTAGERRVFRDAVDAVGRPELLDVLVLARLAREDSPQPAAVVYRALEEIDAGIRDLPAPPRPVTTDGVRRRVLSPAGELLRLALRDLTGP